MAALPAGMKQVRTASTWGSPQIHYEFKGVQVRKSIRYGCNSWAFRIEEFISETNTTRIVDSYGDYRLAEVPRSMEKYLQDPNYILDTARGWFRLTEARKTELKELARVRVMNEMESLEKYLTQYLQEKNWDKLASMADRMKQFTIRNAWALEVEEVTA